MNKKLTLVICSILCLAANSYAQEGSTNAVPPKAAEKIKEPEPQITSEAQQTKSLEPRGGLKIKGLFIGQNVYEANENANRLLESVGFPTNVVFHGTNMITGIVSYSVDSISNPGIHIRADSTGLVTLFVFDKEVLPKLFKTENLSEEQFIKQFAEGYKLDDFDAEIGTTIGGDDFTYYVLESTSGYKIEYNRMNLGELRIYKTSSSKNASFN